VGHEKGTDGRVWGTASEERGNDRDKREWSGEKLGGSEVAEGQWEGDSRCQGVLGDKGPWNQEKREKSWKGRRKSEEERERARRTVGGSREGEDVHWKS